MSWNNQGVFSQAPPGASGLPQMPQGQQTLGPQSQHGQSYSTDHLPPPPGQQQSQPPNPYGVQPGVPGAPMAQPWDTRQPQQQWGTPPQTQPQAPQQPSAPQPQQSQGAPQQQGRRAELDDNVILDGPGVPPELRGRTWADARRLYQALSVDWLQRNSRQQQSPAPQTPAQQSLQSQGFGQPPQQSQGGAQQQTDPRQFWQNPDQRIAEVVGQVVEQRLGPVLQHTQGQAIMQARQIAATTTRDFDYLEPDIMQIVSGANPQDLQNPQVWIAAARMARGQRMESGQYDPRAAQQRSQVPGQQSVPGGPGQSVPAYQAPPVHQFFSESPTAPNIPQAYGSFGQAQQPTQEDYHYAQKHQMPIQEFMAWKYGTPQTQPMGSF